MHLIKHSHQKNYEFKIFIGFLLKLHSKLLTIQSNVAEEKDRLDNMKAAGQNSSLHWLKFPGPAQSIEEKFSPA